MNRLLSSKKGFKIPITIVALLFLALVIILFSVIFTNEAEKDNKVAKAKFSAIGTDVILNSFLQTPVFEGIQSANDLTPGIGNQVTNADLISWTCKEESDDRNFKVLKSSTYSYFQTYYPPAKWSTDKQKYWTLVLYYYSDNKDVPVHSIVQFGTRSLRIEYFDFKKDYERGSGATQVIPCMQKDVFAKVALFINEYTPNPGTPSGGLQGGH